MSLDRLVGIFGLLFFAAIAVRVYLVYRETGRFPIIIDNSDSAHAFVHKMIAGIAVLETINVVAFRLHGEFGVSPKDWPTAFYQFLGPITALETTGVQIAGLVMAYLALLFSVVAQYQMGKDWRVGIDSADDVTLVTGGLYVRSRHPIYLGFMIVTAGLFLCAPTVLSLFIAVLTTIILSIEARLEEEFLAQRHGDAYREYLGKTRRWI